MRRTAGFVAAAALLGVVLGVLLATGAFERVGSWLDRAVHSVKRGADPNGSVPITPPDGLTPSAPRAALLTHPHRTTGQRPSEQPPSG